jgi:Caudovirus prohead serine protease
MRKSLGSIEIKNALKGEVSAVFSTFNVIDKDGDVTVPGAFRDGADVVISAYGHQSWSGALPVGHGKIRTTPAEAMLEGTFLMDTAHGRDTFNTVKALSDNGLQEWSYGFDVLASDPGTFDGKDVRFLKALKVHEVSPVLQGAGMNTRTLEAKDSKGIVSDPYSSAIKPHETGTDDAQWFGLKTFDAIADGDVNALRSVFTWVDPSGDPERKASYRLLHHDADGKANVRACLIGIGILNGANGKGVPAHDRRAAWNHLAKHLEDADREAIDLTNGQGDGSLKFIAEGVAVLAALSSFNDRASDVMALRAVKGKGLAAASADILGWLYDEMRRTKSLIDTPQEDAARELARFIQQTMTRGD